MPDEVVEPVRSIGKVQKYVVGADFESYAEQLEFYFLANGITDLKQRKAVLLTNLPTETYQLAKDLVAPNLSREDTVTYTSIVERLQKQLKPQKSALVARYEFDNRSRKAGETVSEYVANLKHLATECKFNEAMRLERLRDRLVSGIQDKKMMSELLKLKLEELTFDIAVAKCIAIEQSYKDIQALQGGVESNPVNMLTRSKQKGKARSKQDMTPAPKEPRVLEKSYGKKCYRCKGDHEHKSCPFKKEQCHYCKKTGHIQRACRQKSKAPQGSRAPVNCMGDGSDESSAEEIGDMYHTTASRSERKPFTASIQVEGQDITMEIDTGSAVSIITERVYLEYFQHLQLQESSLQLRTYTGEVVKPEGVINVTVIYQEQAKVLPLYVLKSKGPCLFGRDWMAQIRLDWPLLHMKTRPRNLTEVLGQHAAVFSEGLGRLKNIKAQIHLKEGAQPRFYKARTMALARKPAVEQALENLEGQGVLKKITHSEWATPIVTPVKKDGSVRVCGDFKVTVNPQLEIDEYPLPRIDDIYANLSGGKQFSVLDLRQAYLQMEVDEAHRKYLTINTHRGLFQYQRLPYGVASAPAIWQRSMDQVLQGISGAQCYLDDIIVTGKTLEEHLATLDQVLQRLEEYGLKVNQAKCKFLQDSVEYLGHVISASGLQQSPAKVEAIINMPAPEGSTQLRSFIGMAQYYARFMPNLATELAPLHHLLKKDVPWQWTETEQDAFEKVKSLLLKDNVLVHYDSDLPLVLASDSSSYGLGAVLSHVMPDGSDRPIAYASRSLSVREKKYAQIEKEALSIVWGVKKFQTYLEGRRFSLITDHKPLKYIMDPGKAVPVTAAARLQRWCLFLGAFSYTIQYRNTKQHANCDGLSRLPLTVTPPDKPDETEVHQLSVLETLPVKAKELKVYTRRDPVLAQVMELVQTGWEEPVNTPEIAPYAHRRDEITVHQGQILMWGNRVIVPRKLQDRVLETIHEGHLGVGKMKGLARGYVWWPNLDKDIECAARNCDGCQELGKNPASIPLHRWEFPAQPWQRLHVDFAGPIQGKMILVCTDAHSKWPEVVVMKNTSVEETVATLRSIFARMGFPEQMVTDNGPQFTSHVFKKFTSMNGVRHVTGAPYHPSTNGMAERLVQSFKHAVKADKSNRTLEHKIDRFLLAYRTAPHATTGISPAQLIFQRNPRTRLDLIKPDLKRDVDSKLLVDESRKFTQFPEGERVWIRNYRNGPKWVRGTVLEQTGPVLYKVQTQDKVWKRHMDQLRCDRSCASPNTEPQDDHDAGESDAGESTSPIAGTTTDAEVDPPEPTLAETETELTTRGTTELPQDHIPTAKTTRCGRVVKTPARFQDFVRD